MSYRKTPRAIRSCFDTTGTENRRATVMYDKLYSYGRSHPSPYGNEDGALGVGLG